jgi:hypothetical protein
MSDLMWARDAEKSLLGSLLISPKRIHETDGLIAEHFDHAPGHPAIFTAITSVLDAPEADHLAVMQELTRTQAIATIGRGKGATYLHELMEARGAGDLRWLAVEIGKAAQRRNVSLTLRRAIQAVEGQADYDTAMGHVAEAALTLEASVDDPLDSGPIEGLSLLGEFVDKPRRALPWVIPGALRRQERIMLIARPGTGKSMLGRQVATCVASGWHPFEPKLTIPAQVTLIVDLENPDDIIADKTRPMVAKARSTGLYAEDGAWIWHRPEGIDIRTPAGFREFERVVEQCRPALVYVGPLYKLTTKAGDDWETVAEQTARALDRLRVRHDFALWIEHHMPKGADNKTPFGSSLWERWPEFGKELVAPTEDGENFYALENFRPDRDERTWPLGLQRGGAWPWSPVWSQHDQHVIDQLLAKQRRQSGDAA